MDRTRVLVVDDEPNVGRFLTRALNRLGFTVTVAHSVDKAWPLIESQPFDLLLVDKTMPEKSGLVLLQQLKDSEHEIPAVLITGDASVETIDEALALGAEDYIAKPFVSTNHLVQRLQSVLDRRVTGLLFDVMLSDLSKALHSGTGKSEKFTKLSQTLLELKVELGKRPACAVVDDDPKRCEERRAAIYEGGVIAVGVSTDDVDKVFNDAKGPMVAAVSLESKDSLKLVEELHQAHPNLLILAFANETDVKAALHAVEAGASDFTLLMEEGMAACSQRIERLVGQARRHFLYLEIASLLYKAARESRPDLADDIIFVTSEADRDYILAP
jgi:DNA-binding NtrC family response regulator